MSWSYSGDPGNSDLDYIRFILGDTDENNPLFQDGEILFLLEKYSNVNKVLYELYTSLANRFARDIKRSLGPQSEDPSNRQKYFSDKAAEYKALLSASGLSEPVYGYPKVFKKGMGRNV